MIKRTYLWVLLICAIAPNTTKAQVLSDTIGYINSWSGLIVAPVPAGLTTRKTFSIYSPTELAANGIVPGMTIYGLGYHKTDSNTLLPGATATLDLHIRCGGQDTVIPTSWPTVSWPYVINNYLSSGFQPVMQYANGTNLTIPPGLGWVQLMLDAPFVYTGGSLEVYIDWQSAVSSATGYIHFSHQTLPQIVSFVTNYPQGGNSSGGDRPSTIIYHSPAPPICTGTPVGGNVLTLSNLCANQNFTMYILNCSAGPGISYQWQTAPSGSSVWTAISGATNPSYTTSFATPTQYRVKVSCTASGQVAYSTSALAQPFVFDIDTIYSSITGNSVTLTAHVNDTFGVNQYFWSFGDGLTYAGNPVPHTYTIDSAFTVRVNAMGSCNADTAYKTVYIGCPSGYYYHNTIAAITDTIICPGKTAKLKTTSPPPSGYTGQWQYLGNFGVWYDIASATIDSIIITPVYTTKYRHKSLCTMSGNKKYSQIITITVVPPPDAGVIHATKIGSKTYSFTTTGTTGAASYQWSFGDGATASTAVATHQYSIDSNYSVVLTVTSAQGCIDTAVFHMATVGIHNVGIGAFSVYPNPAHNSVTIAVTGHLQQVNIELTDITGKHIAELYEGNVEGLKQALPLPQLTTGLYFVHITADGNKLPVQKLMIE